MINDGRAPINVAHDMDDDMVDDGLTDDGLTDDGIQHGIDDNPHNDAAKGAITGGIGSATMGAIAGSMLGPAGAVAGALIGGAIGAAASGAAVAVIDRHDNDNNITGLGDSVARDHDDDIDGTPGYVSDTGTGTVYPAQTTGSASGAAPMGTMADPINDRDSLFDSRDRVTPDYTQGSAVNDTKLLDDRVYDDPNRTRDLSNGIPGVQTGGYTIDGAPDTRGVTEKATDAMTGDRMDDKTGRIVR